MAGQGMYADQRAVGRRQRRGGAGLHRQATYSTSVYEREAVFSVRAVLTHFSQRSHSQLENLSWNI